MERFEGKTAVVTGAASGIGRALADRFVAAKMRVVLADVETAALQAAEEALLERGGDVIAVETDVRSLESIKELHRRAIDAFGKVHVLCNNAGVMTSGLFWELTDAEVEWTLGVNLWGVMHGVRTFLPGMIAHGEEGHIVNTASIGGLIGVPLGGAYNVSKVGVVGLSETLFYDLKSIGSRIGVSVLCPGFVDTRILDSSRNWPAEFGQLEAPDSDEAAEEELRALMAAGMPPADVARAVVDAIRSQQLHVLPHPEFDHIIRERTDAILARRAPVLPGFA